MDVMDVEMVKRYGRHIDLDGRVGWWWWLLLLMMMMMKMLIDDVVVGTKRWVIGKW